MKEKDSLIACLGVILGFILIPLIAILQGWVFTVLWGWFVVPTFHAPELSIAVAIGLTIVVGMFRRVDIDMREKTSNEKLTEAIATIVMPFVFLFLGWIVTLFM
jgi:hypothetical protein